MLYLDIVRSPYAHANIKSIDASAALALPGVLAVITGKDLDAAGLAWMPTLMSDKQMVLPVDRVVYQAQEVAAVVATERYIAADGITMVAGRLRAADAGHRPHQRRSSPMRRWFARTGSRRPITSGTGKLETLPAPTRFSMSAEVVVKQDLYIPRIHVCSIETCGCVASFDASEGKLTVYMTTQAPHAIRTVFSLVTGIPEHKIHIISPDIGGGFGGKVPVYPGYVIACVAAIKTGHPIKWIEDRSENIQADSFARDYHISAELAAKRDGTMQALRVKTIADHGAFDAAANPSKFPAGLFSIITGSYDLEAAHVEVDGVYTNKPSGGVAYRCSFRVTEAVHTIERMVDRAGTAAGDGSGGAFG